jgi:hypothetical protein
MIDRVSDNLIWDGWLGQIAGEGGRVAHDLASRLLSDVRVEIVDQDAGALFCQQRRSCPADTSS